MKSSKKTIEKYLFTIQDLSKKTTRYTNLKKIANNYNVGQQFITELRNKNIIIVDANGYYSWNKSVSPNIDIVNSALKSISITNKKFMELRMNRNQAKIQFSNKPFTDKNNVRVTKRKLQEQQQYVQYQIHPQPQIEQIGLIRKFIKFIW